MLDSITLEGRVLDHGWQNRYHWPLLDVMVQLHMAHTGAGDSTPEMTTKLDWLRWRIRTWQPSVGLTAPFDNAVLALARAVFAERGESLDA